MQHADFLIVGGGIAGATAAETLRTADTKGSIVVLSAGALPPYFRPALSKSYLTGDRNAEQLYIHPESFYRELAIGLQLNTRALSVNPSKQIVTTGEGDIGYGRLLIATGGVPKPLDAPGAFLPGVFCLRTMSDADAIRHAARVAKHAVVAGGSYLGMEIAFSLLQLGLCVTVIERGPILLPFLEATDLSVYFKRYAESQGLEILLNDAVAALHGQDKLQEAETVSGRSLPCGLLAVAVGISPASKFLAGSGVALDDGFVTVDERLRASVPNVYAAGDVANFYDPVFGRRRQIQHWDNAAKQGRLAAFNMLGRRVRYDEVSYYFCDLGDISFNVLGAPEEAHERIARGSLDERSYALFYLKNNTLRALFTTGRPAAETRSAEELIRRRTNVAAIERRLSIPGFALQTIPAQTVLVLQGGGALGAFECGAVKALEEKRIFPDIVAGVSIGAINGAIIAANPRNAAPALDAFWKELAVATPLGSLLPAPFERTAVAMNILALGVPKFFRPRWAPPYSEISGAPMNWTSFYDPSPMKALIGKYVDFAALKTGPVRLLIGAVNVATAELEVFDSFACDFTPEHILASGSLPPGFPWTVIDGEPYWDGGIVSNSPLDFVTECCGTSGKRIFVVDLFVGRRALPTNMMEVLARRDEIVYAERVRSGERLRETANAYRALVNGMLAHATTDEAARIKQWPLYIQLMSDGAPSSVVRIVRPAHESEQASRDYDFSDIAIQSHQREGYSVAKQALRNLVEPGGIEPPTS